MKYPRNSRTWLSAEFNHYVCYTAGAESEAGVEKYFSEQTSSLLALGAVVFDAGSFDAGGNNVRRDASHITYKIRLRAEQYDGTYRPQPGNTGDWLTSHMFPRRPAPGPRGDMYGGDEPGSNDINFN